MFTAVTMVFTLVFLVLFLSLVGATVGLLWLVDSLLRHLARRRWNHAAPVNAPS